jgi:hypothetical protein
MSKSNNNTKSGNRNFLAMEMNQGDTRKRSKRFDFHGNGRRAKDVRNTKSWMQDLI